jgi:N-acetylmuramoyl-L-alanine amidase
MKELDILIGLGHGPNTFKKTGGKGLKLSDGTIIEEFELNKLMANTLKNSLDENPNIKTGYINEPDINYNLSLPRRKNIINFKKPHLYMSIHHDASKYSKTQGFTIWYWNKNSLTKKLAQELRDELVSRGFIPSPIGNGVGRAIPNVKWPNFYILREPVANGLLIECGYFTNSVDRKKTFDLKYRTDFCNTIKEVLEDFFDIQTNTTTTDYKETNKHIKWLEDLKLIFGKHEAKENITWEEFAIVLKRLYELLN